MVTQAAISMPVELAREVWSDVWGDGRQWDIYAQGVVRALEACGGREAVEFKREIDRLAEEEGYSTPEWAKD